MASPLPLLVDVHLIESAGRFEGTTAPGTARRPAQISERQPRATLGWSPFSARYRHVSWIFLAQVTYQLA